MKTLIFVLTFLLCTFSLHATIINIPADQPTIQAGIDTAVDADTVLVADGTYFENIDFIGKAITVASHFIIDADTLHIENTIINGSQPINWLLGSCVRFTSGESNDSIIIGFTITEGYGTNLWDYYYGGGIYCSNNSSPSLFNLTITGNTATSYGGGIYCSDNSSPSLVNVTISGNTNYYMGGGIYFEYSSPSFENVTISGNIADYGGGIVCWGSSPNLENVTITRNIATGNGGGIYCSSSSPSLVNVTISDNSAYYHSGGGIYCYYNSNPILENVTISSNTADYGGGIYCESNSSPSLENVTITNNEALLNGGGIYCSGSSPSFHVDNRCNIYSNIMVNTRGFGSDIFAEDCDMIHVIVDTFTVMIPTDYYASPLDNFTFDILHCVVDSLINADVYVAVDGDDSNNGISPDLPFRTINYALSRIYSDSLNINTIHLAPGVYSNSTNEEIFPIYLSSYINLSGNGESETILDADNNSSVMDFYAVTDAIISNITITNGSADYGGGIYCRNNSSPSLFNVTITGNSAGYYGGGIFCSDYSSPSLENVTISANYASSGGGINCRDNSSPSLVNVTISNNGAGNWGGGIDCHVYSNPSLVNVTIINNSADWGGGIHFWESSPSLVNVSISGNIAYEGGGIYFFKSSSSLVNCIMWNNSPEEIYFNAYWDPNSISVSYSDIQGGEDGIVTNNNGTVNWLEGNIDEDPLFAGTGNHPFMLQDLSPCVNTGIEDTTGLNLPELDLAGNLRIYGDRIDMGAYENQNVVVDADEDLIPLVTKLYQNYPNPFNPSTTISFLISNELNEQDEPPELVIYNIKGQKIKTFECHPEPVEGRHSIIWNGTDSNKQPVASGIYFYKLKAGKEVQIKKMILLR